MQIAEKLYTSGYISYPRTETNIFPKELNLTPLVEMQTQDQRWSGKTTFVLHKPGLASWIELVIVKQTYDSHSLRMYLESEAKNL